MLSGARDTEANNHKTNGSATVEAAIVLPFFLMLLFSLAYLIRVFFAYNMIQTSLAEVARRLSNMSYFYHVTGLKDYSDQLKSMADEAGSTLEDQKKTLIQAFDAFNGTVSQVQGAAASGSVSFDDIQSIIAGAGNFDNKMDNLNELVQTIIADPKAELRLIMRIFAQKLSYEAANRLFCIIAKGNLKAELAKRIQTQMPDPASALGIINGMEGLDFAQSTAFGDSESLELVVSYSIRPPVPFGFSPDFKLSNRIKVIAWTGGRGKSVKVKETPQEEADEQNSETSIWMEMDNDKKYMDRGLAIEKMHIKKLMTEGEANNKKVYAAPQDYYAIDAYSYDEGSKTAELYDIFTLNPFLKTYSDRPSAIKSEIKKHGKRLLDCELPSLDENAAVEIKPVVIMIIPENSGQQAIDAYYDAREELAKYNVEVRLYKGYGKYTPPATNDGAAEAA